MPSKWGYEDGSQPLMETNRQPEYPPSYYHHGMIYIMFFVTMNLLVAGICYILPKTYDHDYNLIYSLSGWSTMWAIMTIILGYILFISEKCYYHENVFSVPY